MIYIFYIMVVLISVFLLIEVAEAVRGREWGENP